MPISRRDFFRHGGEAAVWTALLAGMQAQARGEPAQDEPQEPLAPGETDLAAFWSQSFAPPSAPHRGESKPADGSEIEFVQFGPKGARRVQDIAKSPEDLSSLAGDVMLDVTPGRFRAGDPVGGSPEGGFIDAAQLRLDIHQTKSFLGVLPMLAWASAAAVSLDKKGKPPSTQSLDFTTVAGEVAINKILLPGGTGSLQLNVFVANKPSPFLKVLQELATLAEAAIPALGLPAISVEALKGFSLVCGKLEGRGRFLISTPKPQEIAVTQNAWPARASKAMPFPPGDYLMYPIAHDNIVQPEFHDLAIESGFLVNSKLDSSLTLAERADKTAPGLTYVTIRVNVSPVPVNAGTPTKKT
ncbi:MAG TPA: hypothetical protein VMA71_02835 [Alloacidobacterium sp.]|nr:hypothetical protein [Alloacidobacterium sp.]